MPCQDLTLTSLKVQNCIVDEGLDLFGPQSPGELELGWPSLILGDAEMQDTSE